MDVINFYQPLKLQVRTAHCCYMLIYGESPNPKGTEGFGELIDVWVCFGGKLLICLRFFSVFSYCCQINLIVKAQCLAMFI